VANIQSLAQLEIDLSSQEMLRLCTRPTGNPKGSPKTQLDKNIQSGTSVSCKDLAEKMLNPKLARNSETGLKELEGAPWPLTVQSLYHWSSKARKNAKRDVPKLALMALTEVLVVSKYRPRLFLESTAACILRTKLHKTLDYGLKTPEVGAQLQGQSRIKWTYADGLLWEPKDLPPHVDAKRLLLDHAHLVDAAEGGQEVVGLLGRVLRHKAALMKPGDPTYGNMVAPEVAGCVQNLLEVSSRSCLI